MDYLDLILTVAALVIGVMLLTGHGSVFMKGGNAEIRRKLYDEKNGERLRCSIDPDRYPDRIRYVYNRNGF